jgi:1-acyl-sn-glycerol-3-phosphate acyltransferase
LIRRRLLTIPRTAILWLTVTAASPLLLLLTSLVDLTRRIVFGKPWIATRLLVIGWVYLAAEVGVIVVAGAQWLLSFLFPGRAATMRREWSYSLQTWWVNTIMAAMKRVFRLEFVVSGSEAIPPGPIIVLFRHVSIMDNLLPHVFVSQPHRIRLRWVLKKELLSDPALDIGGNRMPNYFVDRDSHDPETERANIAQLAEEVSTSDGILLFPEGTRFSKSKRARRMAELAVSDPDLHALLANRDNVLPPRSGGVLALLDTGMDVVVAAHTGFEELRGIKEIWTQAPVGRTISIRFRRYRADDIPVGIEARKKWLCEAWVWVAEQVEELSRDRRLS